MPRRKALFSKTANMQNHSDGNRKKEDFMRYTQAILCIVLILIGFSGQIFAQSLAYRDGFLLVRFADSGTGAASVQARNNVVQAAGGGSIVRMYSLVPGLGLVQLPAGRSVPAAQAAFTATIGVQYAEPDYLYQIQRIPNDLMFSELWGLRNIGQTGGSAGADIKAVAAWDRSIGSRNVIVAVLDSGVDYTHPDLAANIWVNTAERNGRAGVDDDGNGYVDDIYGYDFWNGDSDPMDDNDHGTHVAGTIGAVGNNSVGVVGVCWQVQIMALKIGSSSGSLSTSAAIEALEYAKNKGAHLTNNSWGGGSYSQALYDAIKACQDAGILFVAAAGNSSGDNDASPFYPASYDLDVILSVLATTDRDTRASFSNWGKTRVDVGAPGDQILSTLAGGRYGRMSGTSMASPHVAGCAALLKAIKPTITYAEIKQTLIETSDKISALADLSVSGGRVNLQRAVTAMDVDLLAPTPNPAQWDIAPTATGPNQIVMQAAAATDPSGVQYYFECLTDAALSSGWQDSAVYQVTTANPATEYLFRVRYRDKSPQQNTGGWSEVKSAITSAAGVDNLPPAPSPARWAAVPRYNAVSKRITMAAMTHYDQSGVEYKFECVATTDPMYSANPAALSSAWQATTSYTISNIQIETTGKEYRFRLLVRDKSSAQNMATASTVELVIVGPPPRTLTVPYPYPTIQSAIDAANPNDTVVVRPGTYRGAGNRNIQLKGKAITVRSENPNDPAIVAATIIDPEGALLPTSGLPVWEPRRAFVFDQNETNLTVVNGFTIVNAFAYNHPQVAPRPDDPADGADAFGGAIYAADNASPTLLNLAIRNCYAYGQDGRRGNDGKDAQGGFPAIPGENGGKGGAGAGGAMYFAGGNKPILQNIKIVDVYALGGDGGDGGKGVAEAEPGNGGDGNNGLGGAIYFGNGCEPKLTNVSISNARTDIGVGGSGGLPATSNPSQQPGKDGRDGQNSWGGAIYFGSGCKAVLDNCRIELCQAVNGIGGAIFAAQEGVELTIRYSQFISNQAEQNSGAVHLILTKSAIFENSVFDSNITNGDGGAVNFVSEENQAPSNVSLRFQSCEFINNRSSLSTSTAVSGAGGAVNLSVKSRSMDSMAIFNDCRFDSCRAEYGGAISSVSLDVALTASRFSKNQAEYGGAIFWSNANAAVTDCRFENNAASPLADSNNVGASGAALYAVNSGFVLKNNVFIGNQSAFSGGALVVLGSSYWLEPKGSFGQDVWNNLFVDNQAGMDGGAISAFNGAALWLINNTLAKNRVIDSYGRGGAISVGYDYLGISELEYPIDFYTYVVVDNSILWDNTAVFGPQVAVGDPLKVYNLPSTVEFYHSALQGGIENVYLGTPVGNPWAYDAGGTISTDPLFVATQAGISEWNYFLSHQAAGQAVDSPAVNAGAGNATGLAEKVGYVGTTRVDRVDDTGIVDMGYHYKSLPLTDVPRYMLKIEIYRGPASATLTATAGGAEPFTITAPDQRQVIAGTVVNLTAALNDAGYVVRGWRNTDNDNTTALTNTVTMTGDKTVQLICDTVIPSLWVTIEGNGTFIAKGNGIQTSNNPSQWPAGTVVTLIAYPSAGDAIRWTNTDDDTLTDQSNTVTMTSSKDVKIKFYQPRTLNVPGDYTDIQYAIDAANDGDIIILAATTYEPVIWTHYVVDKNITIQSYRPDDPAVVAATEIVGARFVFSGTNRSAILNGITLRGQGTWVGRNGCNGKDTSCGNPFEDGSNGQGVNGGCIRFEQGASATVKNCRILNYSIRGGNGGNGTQDGDGGWGGWARGGAVYVPQGSNPRFINCEFIGNSAVGGNGGDAGTGGRAGRGGSWDNPLNPWPDWDWGPYEPYWKYSGFGGAVYCDSDSAAEFSGCLFRNNRAIGGQTGVGDNNWPNNRYKIDRFGGAVYAAKRSKSIFTQCIFEQNETDRQQPEGAVIEDPFFAFGGALALEDQAEVKLVDCVFEKNAAHHGGAIYTEYATTTIKGGRFTENTASFGGALYYVSSITGPDNSQLIGSMHIDGTKFEKNTATSNYGQGGAIFAYEADSDWRNVQFIENGAVSSGGGAFVAGNGLTTVHNALFDRNSAGRDGGGMSLNWHSTAELSNITFANNMVADGKGGGLFCGYNCFASVLDSIFWGNTATQGRQIALSTGYPNTPAVSSMEVRFSNIHPSAQALFIDTNCTMIGYNPLTQNWPAEYGNIGADPLFVRSGDERYYLSQISAGQPLNSPCVDAGSRSAVEAGLDRATTATNSRFDSGRVDMGYHYPLADPDAICRFADLSSATVPLDNSIGMGDLLVFATKWLNACTLANQWCGGADYTFSGRVDLGDFAFLAECWHVADTKAPTPNPSRWVIEPRSGTTTNSIEMSIEPSYDNWSENKVYYYFENVTAPERSSGWRQNFNPAETATYVAPPANPWEWTNTGLTTGQTYTYRAYVKDLAGNVTQTTPSRAVQVGQDTRPPTPNPAQWQTQPYQSAANSIRMVAATATDAENNGVEYRFVCTTHPALTSAWRQNINVNDPGYVANPREYEVTGLTVGQTYTFYTISRDRSPNQNQTLPSPSISVTLGAEPTVDIDPPTPNPAEFEAASPFQLAQSGTYYHVMVAKEATDPSGVEYRFICVDNSALSSGWRNVDNVAGLFNPNGTPQRPNEYWRQVGVKNLMYRWQVQYRDRAPTPNVGTPSPAKQITNTLP